MLPRTQCSECGSYQVGAAAGSPCLICRAEAEYQPPRPDFDFPMSCAWYPEGQWRPQEPVSPQQDIGIQPTPAWELQGMEVTYLEARLDDLQGEAKFTRTKLIEHLAPKRQKTRDHKAKSLD